jgi:hypothetical protein
MSAEPNSIRADLEAAIKEVSETPEPEPEIVKADTEADIVETPAEKEARARDEKGRFVAKPAGANDTAPPAADSEAPPGRDPSAAPGSEAVAKEPEAPRAEGATQALAPPNGWSAEAKAVWHEAHPAIQAAAQKREQDVAKFISQRDEHASFGKEVYQTVQPYLAQIQAEGGTPTQAIRSLFNTAYVLRTGSPEQKRHLLLQTAQHYGVDLGQGEAHPGQPLSVQAEVDRVFAQREQAEQQRKYQEAQIEAQTEIEAFAADPKHTHYETVKGHMAALIGNGAAKDLQDAYDQAVWARPDTRATLLAQQRAEEEQKRRTEAKAKADAARARTVGITGGPGNTASASAPGSKGSVRDDIQAAMAAHSGTV